MDSQTDMERRNTHENNFNHTRQKIFFEENYGHKEYKTHNFGGHSEGPHINYSNALLTLPFMVIMQQKLSKVSCFIFNKKGPKVSCIIF
jgi:hypothetical protein